MRSLKKKILFLLIICILLFLGYYRDFVFKNINALLKAWDFNMDYSMPLSLGFLKNYNYDMLVNIKWLLTLLFSLIYMSVAIITINLFFKNRNYIKITIAVYIGITILSGLFIAVGYLVEGSSEKMYEFARYLMGMLQSPIILMILIPAFKLSEKENKNITN